MGSSAAWRRHDQQQAQALASHVCKQQLSLPPPHLQGRHRILALLGQQREQLQHALLAQAGACGTAGQGAGGG